MRNLKKLFWTVFCLQCIWATHTLAHRPVRVLIVTYVGSSGYQCTCIKNGLPYLINELQHPGIGADSSNVLAATTVDVGVNPSAGQKFPLTGLTPYDSGFLIDTIGNASNGAPIASIADGHRLVSKLPNYDVLIFMNNTAMGNLLPTAPEQDSLLTWMQTHGTFALGTTLDTHQIWPEFDSVLATTFPNTGNGHTTYFGDLLADSTPTNATDSNFQLLRSGLSPNTNPSGTTLYTQPYSYRFYAEWFSLLQNPRNAGVELGWDNPHIVETLNEASLSVGASPTSTQEADAAPMTGGDHPQTWYRLHSEGGRLYVHSLPARVSADTFYMQNNYLRRSIYNAILWAAGFPNGPTSGDGFISEGATSLQERTSLNGDANLSKVFMSGSTLTISFPQIGQNAVEVRGLDGRLVASAKGNQQQFTITNLRRNGVYEVTTSTSRGLQHQLIATE